MPKLTLDNFWNGISTQPGWRKFPGQCSDAENVLLEVGRGAGSRPPMTLIANLWNDAVNPPVPLLWPGSRYKRISVGSDSIIIGPDGVGVMTIFAFDADGEPLTITDVDTIGFGYLGTDVEDLYLVSAEDTVLVLNRTVTVAMEAAPTATVSGSKATYDDLPAAPAVDEIWKVKSDWNAFPAGHYKCTSAAPVVWERIAEPDQANAVFTRSTMFHRLIRNGSGGFDWGYTPFKDRLSGDDLLNPPPKWVGQTIRAIEFHSGRLFASNKQSHKSSRAGDFFNLWIDNVNKVGDADPVSVDIAARTDAGSAGELLWLAGVKSTLVVAFENVVQEFTSYDRTLTGVNGQQRVVWAGTVMDVRPAIDGGRLYLVDGDGGIRRLEFNDLGYVLQYADDASAHVREGWLDGYMIEGLAIAGGKLYVLTDSDVLVYTLGVVGRKLVQSAWSRFTTSGVVRFLWPFQDHLELYVEGFGGLEAWSHMHMRPIRERPAAPLSVDAYLDGRETIEGTYEEITDETIFAVSLPADLAMTRLVTAEAMGTESQEAGSELTPVSATANEVRFAGRWDYPEEAHLADGSAFAFAFRFAVESAAELECIHNGAAIDPLTWDVTVAEWGESGGTVYVTAISDGSPLPEGDGLRIRRTRKAAHYVGRLYRSALVFESMYVSGANEAPLLRRLHVFHDHTTDYRVEFEAPGLETQVVRFEVDRFNELQLQTGRARTGDLQEAIYGSLEGGRLTLVHDTSGEVTWSRAVLDVDLASQ